MSTDSNKATALQFFQRFSASDVDGALATLSDDATWQLPGSPDRTPTSGLYDKARIGRLFRRMLDQMPGGLAMTVTGTVAEGERVALEVVSQGDLRNGRQYRQSYHVLMEFRDGRIAAVREYLDTQHVHDVWFAPATVG
jgi:hypothetical protein